MSSNLQQYFGDDYFSSLALALRAVYPPLVLTISAWGLRECGYLASRVGSYIKGQYTHTHTCTHSPLFSLPAFYDMCICMYVCTLSPWALRKQDLRAQAPFLSI